MRHLILAMAGSTLAFSAPAMAGAPVCPSGPPTTITYTIESLTAAVGSVIHFN